MINANAYTYTGHTIAADFIGAQASRKQAVDVAETSLFGVSLVPNARPRVVLRVCVLARLCWQKLCGVPKTCHFFHNVEKLRARKRSGKPRGNGAIQVIRPNALTIYPYLSAETKTSELRWQRTLDVERRKTAHTRAARGPIAPAINADLGFKAIDLVFLDAAVEFRIVNTTILARHH